MANNPEWLPGLVQIAEYGGNWERYLESIYQIFRKDFIESQPVFRGSRVLAINPKRAQGKEATFWHIISEGKDEEERNPDFERCKRIRWPRSIIEKGYTEPILKIWESSRGRESRVLIRLTFADNDYLVVLIHHAGKVFLLTAYLVTWASQKRKLQKEYEAFKADAAP